MSLQHGVIYKPDEKLPHPLFRLLTKSMDSGYSLDVLSQPTTLNPRKYG